MTDILVEVEAVLREAGLPLGGKVERVVCEHAVSEGLRVDRRASSLE